VLLASLASFALPVAAAGNGNMGTIKVHDEMEADPDTRNEPHVDCQDFWVEGFNMAVDSGSLDIWSWPPTGNKTLVLDEDWEADDGEPESHFLAGPFTLGPGHYRVEVQDRDNHTKNKMFWVEPCVEEPCEGDDCNPCPGGHDDDDCNPCPGGHADDDECEEPPALECPSRLKLEALSDGSIMLSWKPAKDSDATNIYRAVGGADFVYLTTVDGDEYLDNSTTPGVTYSYTVTGLYGDQESTDCPIATTTAIPNFPTAIASGLAVGLAALGYAFASRRKL